MIDIDAFSIWIGLETNSSKQILQDRLQTWECNSDKLEYLKTKFARFKEAYKDDPTFFPMCKAIFKEIATIETSLNTLMNQDSKLEEETYSELLFLILFHVYYSCGPLFVFILFLVWHFLSLCLFY